MSKLLGQFLLVSAVFAIVFGVSYPTMQDAQRQEKLNHYPDKLTLAENMARRRYSVAQAHPDKIDEYLAAGDELGSVLMTQQNFDQALEIYDKQMSVTWGLVTNAYNPRWVAVQLKL